MNTNIVRRSFTGLYGFSVNDGHKSVKANSYSRFGKAKIDNE